MGIKCEFGESGLSYLAGYVIKDEVIRRRAHHVISENKQPCKYQQNADNSQQTETISLKASAILLPVILL